MSQRSWQLHLSSVWSYPGSPQVNDPVYAALWPLGGTPGSNEDVRHVSQNKNQEELVHYKQPELLGRIKLMREKCYVSITSTLNKMKALDSHVRSIHTSSEAPLDKDQYSESGWPGRSSMFRP